jgi:acyl carrier protein
MKQVTATMADILIIIRVQLGLDSILPEQRFMEDLGAESADMVNIIANTEDKYNISFEEEDIPAIRSVQQLFDKVNEILKQ